MKRMRTFLRYALMLLGFIFLSYILENGLLENMYKTMSSETSKGAYSNISINDINGKASNVSGYIDFNVKNESNNTVNCYAIIDLYSKHDLKASTKYVQIMNFMPGEERDYQVKFRANEIAHYNISLVSEIPDKSKLFNFDGAKTVAENAWDWSNDILVSIPWWGYAIGAGIVLWYLPIGFLF